MLRPSYHQRIKQAFAVHPVVALLGPRQCGKTTLANQYAETFDIPLAKINYFDLENFEDLARLENPQLTLSKLSGLIIIDEIQRIPELFTTLRVMVDNQKLDQQYLILGSASRELIKQSSETLAGRIQYIELTPFAYDETGEIDKLWLRGGFPRSYLAPSDETSYLWREAYIQTFLEQDLPGLGIQIPPVNIRRFWMMLAHYHGNICNYSELGRSLDLSYKTTRHYSDILTSTFMIRQLQPWFENLKKRQVKSHKIYFRDSGLLHTLMNIPNWDDLLLNPKLGAFWEGFMLEEIIRIHRARPQECYFWATQGEAELDLLIVRGLKKYAFEFKYTDRPKITKSMRIALEDLKLDKITVIYPGEKSFYLDEKVYVTNLAEYSKVD